MKNTLSAIVTAVVVVLMIVCNANAQTTISNSSIHDEAVSSTSATDNGEKISDVPDTINKRALRSFQKSFRKVTNEEWSLTEMGSYIATFISDDVRTVVFYNPKGAWHHTIRYYNENKLPGFSPSSVPNHIKPLLCCRIQFTLL